MSPSGNKAKSAYVVMPAYSRMNHIYERVIHYVLEQRDFDDIHVQMAQNIGSNLKEIRSKIKQADIVICDLTGESPAVIYQLGIAHALEKLAIMISQTAANLPFAVRDRRIIQYEDTNIGLLDLRDKLSNTLFSFLTEDLEDSVKVGQLDFPVTQQDLSMQRQALYSNSAESRRFAIRFLGECQDKPSFPNITQIAVLNEEPEMTREAFTAMFKIAPQEARDFLLNAGLRTQPHYLVRERVVHFLGTYEPDEELVNQMIDQLDDSSWGVRQVVCQVLGKWGKSAAIGPLQKRLNDSQLQVRIAAAEAYERVYRARVESGEMDEEIIELTPDQANELRTRLSQDFNTNELEELCYELNIYYEDLPGRTKSDKARELILYCERHGRIFELVKLASEARPNKRSWQQLYKALIE